jgi:uracil-DNA glycosylase
LAKDDFRFPFGQPLEVTPPQEARNAKAFVLGVYASAVHARWIGPQGKEACKALAVATEPHSFWDGGDADAIVRAIRVPEEMGRLEPAARKFNGPSGETLRDRYLAPLGLRVRDCWITDLHDRYFLSPGNSKAIQRYEALRKKVRSSLEPAHLPPRPTKVEPSKDRMERLREEFERSRARLVITLGNEPLGALFGRAARKLSAKGYGEPEELEVFGRKVTVLRLCHPRQAGALGSSSTAWKATHDRWIEGNRKRAMV